MKKIYISILFAVFVVSPFLTFAQDSEIELAYEYAYSIGITTMPTLDQANMYGSLIRSHMAKMMVNYAKNVLGKTPDTSLSCNFTDIANQSTELKWYIREACQLGLMGKGITAFEPEASVTRAQFGTVLSRALWGNMFDGATPYYKDHLQMLKDATIMKKIDTPDMKEVRWYVMLMMMRVVEWASEESACDSALNQFYCSLGNEFCPSECQTSSASAGTLSIQKISDSYDVSDGTYLGSLQLTANSSDIILKNIQVQADSDGTNSTYIRLEQDGVRISPKVTPNSSDIALLTVSNIRISTTKPTVLHLVSNTSLSTLKITSSSTINSSAATTNGDFPIVLQ